MTESSVRVEHKYLITFQQYYSLKSVLNELFQTTNEFNNYPVLSLYYDTPNYEYFFQKINGEHKHVKIRLRKYSQDFLDNSSAWLETKIKIDDRITKRRSKITPFNEELISPDFWPLDRDDLFRERAMYELKPSCFIYYEREVFESFFDQEKLRITFDTNIASYLPNQSYNFKKEIFSIQNTNNILMEIKFKESSYPSYLKSLLQQFSLQRTYFSKYAQGLNRIKKLI